jgi:hypothetical protein
MKSNAESLKLLSWILKERSNVIRYISSMHISFILKIIISRFILRDQILIILKLIIMAN